MTEFPLKLRNYFDGIVNHLKVMATLSVSGSQEIDWGIFFSQRNAMPGGDTAFPNDAYVNGVQGEKPSWQRPHPLWLIPISKKAVTEAQMAMNEGRTPDIMFSALTIRNRGWNTPAHAAKYSFWYEDDTNEWNSDAILTLGIETKLIPLKQAGQWLELNVPNDNESRVVWITTNAFRTSSRLFSFSAPSSHIVNSDGSYVRNELWIGVRQSGKYGDPFISINPETPDTSSDGNDAPIVWQTDGRIDDVLRPAKQPGTDETQKEVAFTSNIWIKGVPIEKKQTASNSDTINDIIGDYVNRFSSKLRRWLIWEKEKIDGKLTEIFYVIYLRTYGEYKSESALFTKYIGRDLTKDDLQNIRTVQICRRNMNFIFLRVRYLGEVDFDRIWNVKTGLVAIGLQQTTAAMPVGLVPEIKGLGFSDCNYFSDWNALYQDSCISEATTFTLTRSIFALNGVIISQPNNAVVKFPLLKHQRWSKKGTPVTLTNVNMAINIEKEDSPDDNGTFFRFNLIKYKVALGLVLRDGSMAFTLNDTSADTDNIGRFRLTFQLAVSQRPFFLWQWYEGIDTIDEIVASYVIDDLSLAVINVEAAGQDLLDKDKLVAPRSLGTITEGAGERASPPLLIPIENNNVTGVDTEAAKYLLAISESVNVGQNHRLDMSLLRFEAKAGVDTSATIKAVVIDTAPQLIALVSARYFQQGGYDNGAWVMARRSPFSVERGSWEILDDNTQTEGFRLIFPAQAIGEAYVKNDLVTPGEPQKDKPIAYSFGAPAMLQLASSRLDKRYVSVPWNLRRILGQAGDIAPGVPLIHAQFELLYGLTSDLSPKLAFIAELGSKLGEMPVPSENTFAWQPTEIQKLAFKKAWEFYVRFYRAYASRLAIFESSADDAFSDATFDTDIVFNARNQQNDVAPYAKIAGAKIKYPILKIDDRYANDQLMTKLLAAHDSNGLAGGFHYGFESNAVYRELWREFYSKGSSSGEIKGLSFSSMGGFGKQTAKFAGDKITIKSTTFMGRLDSYAVERIGRIGVFWHKAKHVIEYKRVVVPSEQFHDQPKHYGRPLVRKVREYVEILSPVRNYPDFETDVKDAPGSVVSCTFKSITIPVLSSWGHDVWLNEEPIGWEVPLWKLGADAKIYPKPQIVLGLLPPPDSDEEIIPLNLSEPQNLWFYTDTRESAPGATASEMISIDANVDKWPPVKHVDYTDLPDPQVYNVAPVAGNQPDQPLPEVIDVWPGFERYTFRVDRSELVSSVAGRYYPNAPVTGRLKTVSMVRSIVRNSPINWNGGPGKVLQKIVDGEDSLFSKAANGFQDLENQLSTGIDNQIDQYVVKVKSWTDVLRTAIDPTSGLEPNKVNLVYFQDIYDVHHFRYQPTNWLWREIIEGGSGALNRIIKLVDIQRKSLIKELNTIVTTSKDLKKEAVEALYRFQSSVLDFPADVEFSIDSVVTTLSGMIDQAIGSISLAADNKLSDLLGLINAADLSKTLADIQIIIRDGINDNFGQVKNALNRVFDQLTQIPAWSTELRDIKTKLTQVVDTFRKQLLAEVDLSTGSATELIARLKALTTSNITSFKNKIDENLNLVRAKVQLITGNALQEINTLNQSLGGIDNEISEQIKQCIDLINNDWNQGLAFVATADAKLSSLQSDIENELKGKISLVLYDAPPNTSVYSLLIKIDDVFGYFENLIVSSLTNTLLGTTVPDTAKIQNWLSTLNSYDRLNQALQGKDLNAKIQASVDFANSLNSEFGRLAGEVAQKVKDAETIATDTQMLAQTSAQTLRNFRSVWEEFTAPGMGLNRKTIAMLVRTDWKDVEQRLSITPAVARLKQFGQQLEGLGLRLPVVAITDRLLPAKEAWREVQAALISNFDFSNLLSDIGGMRLDKLFPGIKMPESARDNIKVTQGFDKENLSAWADAEINISFSEKKALLTIGPLTIYLNNGTFTAEMRIAVDIDGKLKKMNSGQLKGGWEITIAGTPLMIFREARVIFKDDKLSFDLDPKRMEMPGLLKMLTDATTTLSATGAVGGSDPDGNQQEAFKVSVLKTGEIPSGVKAELNIPPISVGGGVTAITNLSFGGFFMLSAMDDEMRFRFLLGLGFYLGRKEKPFNLTIFILGGGGFVDCSLAYEPLKSDGLTVDFAISIHASAAFAISLGWISGSIIIMLGFEMEYHKSPGKGSGVYISFFVYIVGQVDILGIASVYLSLLLQATYKSGSEGNQLVGVGQVKLRIRICRFITINVDKPYVKVFSGSSSNQRAIEHQRFQAAAINGLSLYEQKAANILKTLK